MSALLVLLTGSGAKLIALCSAVIAAIVAAFVALSAAKKAGVTQQVNADLTKGAADNAKAQKATAGVAGSSDDAVQRELRADFTRKP